MQIKNFFYQSQDFNVRALEWMWAIAIAGSMIAPRTSWLFLAILALFAVIQFPLILKAGTNFFRDQEMRLLILALGLFLIYASTSSLWSINPQATVLKMSAIAFLYICALLHFLLLSQLPISARFFVSRGIFFGFIVGLICYLAVLLSTGAISIFLINTFGGNLGLVQGGLIYQGGQVTEVIVVAYNRHAISICFFLWPALYFLWGSKFSQPVIIAVAAFIALLVGLALSQSDNESAKLAYSVGLIAFVAAKVVPKTTAIILLTVWVGSTLLILPMVDLAHRANLHNLSVIQSSGRDRLKIWKATYDTYWNHPIVGVGVRSTQKENYSPSSKNKPNVSLPDGLTIRHYHPHHTHNAFLQVWYELGAIGAILLAAVGWMLLNAVRRSSEHLHSFAYAQFASFVAVIGLSYGIWQTWYQATLLIALLAICAAARLTPVSLGASNSPQRGLRKTGESFRVSVVYFWMKRCKMIIAFGSC